MQAGCAIAAASRIGEGQRGRRGGCQLRSRRHPAAASPCWGGGWRLRCQTGPRKRRMRGEWDAPVAQVRPGASAPRRDATIPSSSSDCPAPCRHWGSVRSLPRCCRIFVGLVRRSQQPATAPFFFFRGSSSSGCILEIPAAAAASRAAAPVDRRCRLCAHSSDPGRLDLSAAGCTKRVMRPRIPRRRNGRQRGRESVRHSRADLAP